MGYYYCDCNKIIHDDTLSGDYTLENANYYFGSNVILPNFLLALVFSKGNEEFYDYDTFLKLGYYIINNLHPYKWERAYGDEMSIQNAIDNDSYLKMALSYNDLGVTRNHNFNLDYYHYQSRKLYECDHDYIYAHKIEELATYFMTKVIDHKDKIKCYRYVII